MKSYPSLQQTKRIQQQRAARRQSQKPRARFMPGRHREAQGCLIENKGVRHILTVNFARVGHVVRDLWTKIVILDGI
jgi:hypothetical protein